MSDLISRADAIEHLKNVKVSYPHADISLPIDLAIKAIEILPSAEAVDCTDFINWLTEEVMDEEMWELNAVAYGEIICRKLVKLGVLETTEEPSYYIRPSAETHEIRTETHGVCLDLISREDALQCKPEFLNPNPNDKPNNYPIGWNDAIKVWYADIKSLPSAEAEYADLPDIPRYYYEKVVGNMAHEINMLKEQLESADAVQGEWRTDKPTEQGQYIVTVDSMRHGMVELMYYGKPMMPNRKVRGKCWYRSDDEWGDVVYDDKDILAWMPLPKPYKGGDTE